MKIITALAFPLIICAAVSFYGCNDKTSPTPPPNAVTDTVSPSIDSDLISVYAARIKYYEELIRDLEADLLYEKEENYIKLVEYGLEIQNLKAALAALENSDIDTIPTSPQPQDKPSPEVESSSPSNLSTSSPFEVQPRNEGLVISGYRGNEREITIPSQIGGLPVVAIGEEAFKGSGVTRVTLPEGLCEIGWFAFSGCDELFEITIPSTVTTIGYGAFDDQSPSLVIRCDRESYAARFAASWGIAFVCN